MDKQRLKVCYVSNYLPGYHQHAGGAERAIFNTADMMRRRGVDVSFLTLPAEKRYRGDFDITPIFSIETFFAVIKKYIEIFKWYIFQFDPICYFSSKRYFKRTKPDIVHFGNSQFLTYAVLLAAKRLKIPVVMSIYDYWSFCPLTTLFDNNGVCRRFHGTWCKQCLPRQFRMIQAAFLLHRKKVFDFFLRKIDKFIVLSESSRQILLNYGVEKDKITVIRLPPPDHFEKIAPAAKTGGKNILFAGWLQKRKGLNILLDAMRIVWEKVPDAKLYILTQKVRWEKEYENLINSRLKEIPQNKYELFLGQKERGEIKKLLETADIIVIPEQWENMSPLIVIEAMFMSKAIVASDIGGIPEFIENGKEGFLAKYSDPKDFADKIAILLNDNQKRETFGRNAASKAGGMFDTESIASQYIGVYKKL